MNIRGMAGTKPFIKRWLSVVFSLIIFFTVVIVVIKRGQYYDGFSLDNSVYSKNFLWIDLDNKTASKYCRNSVQGRSFIADDKGYVCSHAHLNVKGCCIPARNSSERFCCSTCKPNRCCKVFEHCVSCCLQPDKKHILEKVLLRERNSRSPLLRLVSDTFELCLSKCRTSSLSVKQENVYRDSIHKFCYGLDPPNLLVVK